MRNVPRANPDAPAAKRSTFVRDALGRCRPAALGVVANSNTPPERINNLHMRAHALEGWLFREICERLGERLAIEPVTYLVGELSTLQGTELAHVLRELGAEFGRLWDRDWKLAASAARLQME